MSTTPEFVADIVRAQVAWKEHDYPGIAEPPVTSLEVAVGDMAWFKRYSEIEGDSFEGIPVVEDRSLPRGCIFVRIKPS